MKREAEALYRAYLNMKSAHDDLMRQQDEAMGSMIDAFTHFSEGHHALFNDLSSRVNTALARLSQDIATPPPIPDETESFIDQLRRTSNQGHYTQ